MSAAAPAPIHEVGSIDWYGEIKVYILADTGNQVTMLVLESKDGYRIGDTVTRNYRQGDPS